MHKVLMFILLSTHLLGQIPDLDTIDFSIDLAEYVITAQYEPTHYKEAIHRVAIIPKKEIIARGATSLDQALIISPAIRINHDQIFGSTIQMRGIDANNVAILIDGVPIIGRLDGNIDLSQINIQNIERIEIIEGALSSLYGSNAAGGVINLISSKSQVKQWDLKFNTQIESIGQQTLGSQIGFKAKGFTFNVSARYLNYNQYPIDSLRIIEKIEVGNNEFITQSKYPLNPKQQIAYGGFVRYDGNNEWSMLVRYDSNNESLYDYGTVKRPQFNPYSEDDFYFTNRNDLAINFKKNWNNTSIDWTSSLNHYTRIGEEKRFYVESNTFDSLLTTSDTIQFGTFFNRGIITHRITDKIKGIGGVQYAIEQGSGDRIINQQNSDSTLAVFSELAPFLELKYKPVNKTHLSISGRYSFHSIYGKKFTPSALLKHTFSENLVGRISYSQGYRSPSLKELYLDFVDINHNIIGNTQLMPELSHDFQLTVDYQASERLDLAINIYRTLILNRIDLFEYDLLKFQYYNVDEYSVFGFQPTVSFKRNNLQIKTSGSLNFWSTNINEISVPVYGQGLDINNSLQYSFPKNQVQINFNHRHVGSKPLYRVNNEKVEIRTIESYELLDFSLSKLLFENRLNVTSGVRNLLGIVNTQVNGSNNDSNHAIAGVNNVSPGRSLFVSCHINL